MKKKMTVAAILTTAGLLLSIGLFSQDAEAKSPQAEHHAEVKKTGLENALSHVKNERAREAIKRAMERKAAHDQDRDDDEDQDDQDDEELTDQERVNLDVKAVAIDFGGADSTSSVTVPFDRLPDRGENGSVITWKSSAPEIISDDGKTVNRPSAGTGDVTVTLTATLTSGEASATKTFTLIVKSWMTATERVAADKAALDIGYRTGDSSSSVTGPLTLTTTGKYGSAVTWISGSPAIISNDGKTVVRPAAGSGDVTVTLTAILSNNGIQDVKTFQVLVKQQLTDAQKIAADKAALAVGFLTGDSAASVTHPITLPTTGANGTLITWTSSNPAIVSNDGKVVNRPANGSGDASVVMTAVLTYNGLSDVKTFPLTVKQQLTDAQKVAADKAALAIGFSTNDSAYSVTGPLTLPTVGWNGSTILWISGNEAIISNDGKTVVRPTGTSDVSVTLTAVIMSGSSVDTRSFTVIVRHR
jgi:hypothetical protein